MGSFVLFQISSFVATYLIILLQFRLSEMGSSTSSTNANESMKHQQPWQYYNTDATTITITNAQKK